MNCTFLSFRRIAIAWLAATLVLPTGSGALVTHEGSRVWAQAPPTYPSTDPASSFGLPPGLTTGPQGQYGAGYGTPPGTQPGTGGPGDYLPVMAGPHAPTASTRPPGWPGAPLDPRAMPMGAPGYIANTSAAPPVAPPSPLETGEFNGAEIVARVGSEVILASDVLIQVNDVMERNREELAKASPDDLKRIRIQLMKQYLPKLIEAKLAAAEGRRAVPAANFAKFQEQVNEVFDKEMVPELMKQLKVKSRSELDTRLNQLGSSLEARRAAFLDEYLGNSWLRREMKIDPEITHAEMLAYYNAHLSQFETPAKARWEHLMVRLDKYSSPAEARATLGRWGNEILRGRPFAEVAREHSDDLSSSDGGLHDWTSKGSLVSAQLDAAIFGLPVNSLSQIIEDDSGLHIVRVIERKEFHRDSYVEAQSTIKQNLKRQNQNTQQVDLLKKLKERNPVWTIFDEPSSPQTADARGRQLR